MTEQKNISPRSTFPKNEKLKSRKAIDLLFKSSSTFYIHPYKVFFKWQPSSENKTAEVGFAVSTKNFKKAVDRNRIKRLGREAYRLNKSTLLHNIAEKDFRLQVFFVFTNKTLPNFADVQAAMQACLRKLAKSLQQKNNERLL